MTDTLVSSPTAPVVSSPALKKKATTAAKSAAMKKPAAAHPPTSIMVTSAIKELKERKGSSLPAIKKYLAASYQVDPAKMAPFIRKFLSAAVTNGAILQTKGHYKLAVAEAKPKKNKVVKKPIAKKLKPAPASTPKKKKVKIASGEPAAKKAKKTSTKAPKKVVVKPKNAPAKSTAGIPKTLKKTVVKKVTIPK